MHALKAGSSLPNPTLSDNTLALSIAMNVMAALSNHVQGGATVAAAAGVPITPITSPNITRKSSGKFLIAVVLTLSINGGTLADADVVEYNLTRVTPGAVALTPVWRSAASTSTGGGSGQTVVANLAGIFMDTTTAAVGVASSYGLTVTAMNAHTAGIVAVTDGNIFVIELPG
jgi:hypothetical protein